MARPEVEKLLAALEQLRTRDGDKYQCVIRYATQDAEFRLKVADAEDVISHHMDASGRLN